MCLINAAHEHFITQTGKKSKTALIYGAEGPRADIRGRGPRVEKNKYPTKRSCILNKSAAFDVSMKRSYILKKPSSLQVQDCFSINNLMDTIRPKVLASNHYQLGLRDLSMSEGHEGHLFLKDILFIPKLYLQTLDLRSFIKFFIQHFLGTASNLPSFKAT